MQLPHALLLLLLAGLAHTGTAQAQSMSGSTPPDEPGEHAEGLSSSGYEPPDMSGWAVVGLELGLFAGAGTTAGLVLAMDAGADPDPSAADDGHGAAPLIALGLVGVTVGTMALGAWGMRAVAEANQWDPDSGWGVAGVPPGMLAGVALGGALMFTLDPDPPPWAGVATASLGAALGGLGSYFLFRAISRSRGSAGWEVLGAWIGVLAGEVLGFALAGWSRDEGGLNSPVPFATMAIGGALGTGLAHLIAF